MKRRLVLCSLAWAGVVVPAAYAAYQLTELGLALGFGVFMLAEIVLLVSSLSNEDHATIHAGLLAGLFSHFGLLLGLRPLLPGGGPKVVAMVLVGISAGIIVRTLLLDEPATVISPD